MFNILDHVEKLTPWKKHKHKYHCPSCDGPLPVDPKSGKFFCLLFKLTPTWRLSVGESSSRFQPTGFTVGDYLL